MHSNYFPFWILTFLKVKTLAKICHQELSCLEKLHWTVFPFHLCFSVFLFFRLFILAFAPFQNGEKKKKRWIMCKLENLASAHLPNKRRCGLSGGSGHSEFISEAISHIKTMCTGSLRIFLSIPFCFSPRRHHSDRKDSVSFSVME